MRVRKKIPRNVIVVAFVALASGFGQDLITPVLPAFLLTIGVSFRSSRCGRGLWFRKTMGSGFAAGDVYRRGGWFSGWLFDFIFGGAVQTKKSGDHLRYKI